MTTAGLLKVRARFAEGAWQDIAVELERPSVTLLFIGQLPDAVAKTVPYLFTLCARAQRAAAQAALAVAQGGVPRVADDGELWVELLHENLWRLLLDWPPALGLPARKAAFVAWRNARQGETCLDETCRLMTETLWPLAGECLEKLAHGAPPKLSALTCHPSLSLIPQLAPEAWLEYWQGKASKRPAPPLPTSIRTVYQARLAEVDGAVQALANGMPFPVATAGGQGWGVAQTLTARGVLTHAAHVANGRVVNYRVQAPTDSFFADPRALSSLLGNCEFASLDQAKQVLNQAILALDPCLPYEVELQDA